MHYQKLHARQDSQNHPNAASHLTSGSGGVCSVSVCVGATPASSKLRSASSRVEVYSFQLLSSYTFTSTPCSECARRVKLLTPRLAPHAGPHQLCTTECRPLPARSLNSNKLVHSRKQRPCSQ